MKSAIIYRIFYWIPNTIADERVAIGLCLFDKENDQFDSHWISQRDLTRLRNVFAYSSKTDSRDMLSLLSEVKENWKSKAFDPKFWSYLERYWNGIIRISKEKKMIYKGNSNDFEIKSEVLKKQFLPLAQIEEKRSSGRPGTIVRRYEKEVKRKNIEEKVSLGTEIPEHGKYHLLKSIYFDLAAENGQIIGSAGFDLSISTKTLIDKAHAYFEGFQHIRKIEEGGEFSFVLHKRGKPFLPDNKSDADFYDDFRYRCEDLCIKVIQLDELSDYIDELSEMDRLRPLVIN